MDTAQKVISELEKRGFKRQSDGKYRGSSPFRPGSDSNGFVVTIHDGEHGTFHDHGPDGKEGSLYDLAELFNIEVPKNGSTPVQTTKRKYEGLADYAQAHGVSAEVFSEAGWKETEYQGRPALAFTTGNGTRYRFIDGEKPYYKHEVGYKSCWYGLGPALKAVGEGGALVLCNGEASTVVANAHGIPAFAVTSGEKSIPDDLLKELREKWSGDIIITPDCDPKGRETAKKLQAQLTDYNVTVVDMKLSDGGDLADFCKLYGDSAAEEIKKRAQPTTPPVDSLARELAKALSELSKAHREERKDDLQYQMERAQKQLDKMRGHFEKPKVLSFKDILLGNYEELQKRQANKGAITGLKCNIKRVDELIGGFDPNKLYSIYGDTGMGKTTFVVSLAGELIKQAPGLIIPTESNPGNWMNKLIARNLRLRSDQLEYGNLNEFQMSQVKREMQRIVDLKCGMTEDPAPTVDYIEAAVADYIEEWGIKWVIIDSLSNVSGLGTGIYEETRSVSKGIQQRVALKHHVAVIQTVQIGRSVKGRANKRPGLHDAKGAGDIEQDSDVVMTLYNHDYYVIRGEAEADEEKYPENTALLTIEKHRWLGTAGMATTLAFVGGSGFYAYGGKEEDRMATA